MHDDGFGLRRFIREQITDSTDDFPVYNSQRSRKPINGPDDTTTFQYTTNSRLGSQLRDQKTPTMKQNQKETKSTFNLQVEPEVQLQVYSTPKGVLEGSKVSWNTCNSNDQK